MTQFFLIVVIVGTFILGFFAVGYLGQLVEKVLFGSRQSEQERKRGAFLRAGDTRWRFAPDCSTMLLTWKRRR